MVAIRRLTRKPLIDVFIDLDIGVSSFICIWVLWLVTVFHPSHWPEYEATSECDGGKEAPANAAPTQRTLASTEPAFCRRRPSSRADFVSSTAMTASGVGAAVRIQ
jgi:hypothetical protein